MTKSLLQGSDRRRHARHKLGVGNVVGFSRDGLEYEGVIVDISMGGLRLRMTERAPLIEDDFTLMHERAGPLQVRQSWCRGTAMGIEFAVADDSELARSLRCVQILLDGSGDSDTDATDRAEPKPEVDVQQRRAVCRQGR
jgi:hypothetical protein